MTKQTKIQIAGCALVIAGCVVLAGDFLRGAIAFALLWLAEDLKSNLD